MSAAAAAADGEGGDTGPDDATANPLATTGAEEGVGDDDGGAAAPLWIVQQTHERPVCVCCASYCAALLVSAMMFGGLASGAITFELDTSPSSFKLKGDSVADRGDAFAVFDTHTTDKPPACLRCDLELELPETPAEAEQHALLVDTREGDFTFFESQAVAVYFEARNNQEYVQGGTGANLFSPEHMRAIRTLEDRIAALPSWPTVCRRRPGTEGQAPAARHCASLEVSAANIGYARSEEIPAAVSSLCCDCSGASPVANRTCIAAPLCTNRTGNPAVGVVLSVPDGAAAAPAPNLGDILQQLAAANACENPSLPLAGDLRRYMDSDFSVSNPQSTTSFSVLQLGGVMDLSSVSGASGADRARYVEDNWQAQIRAPVRSFILDELIPLTDEFNEQPDDENGARLAAMSQFHLEAQIFEVLWDALLWGGLSGCFVSGYICFHTKSLFLTLLGQAGIWISFPVTWFIYRVFFGIKYFGMLNFMSMFVIMGIGADDIFVFVDAWRQSRLVPDAKVSGSELGRLDWTYRRAANAMLVTSITDSAAFYCNMLSSITVVKIFGVFMGTMILINFSLIITYFSAVVVIWHRLGLEDQWKPQLPLRGARDDDDSDAATESAEPTKPKRRALEIFFEDFYAPKVLEPKETRLGLIGVFVLWILVFAGLASQLKANDKDFRAEAFPSDSNLMRVLEMMERFPGREPRSRVYFVLGMAEDGTAAIDRSQSDETDPRDYGAPTWDPAFDASSPAAQQHVLTACEAFRGNSLVNSAAYYADPREQGVWCFMDHFKAWVEEMGREFPVVPASDFEPLLGTFATMPSNETCNRVIDDVASLQCKAFWATLVNFPSAHTEGGWDHRVWSWNIRWDAGGKRTGWTESGAPGGALRGFFIPMNASMKWDISGPPALAAFTTLEDTATAVNDAAPSGFKGFQVEWQGTDNGSKWMHMRTDAIMRWVAASGCAISCLFVFVVLSISTRNVLIALLSTVCIGGIVISCVGFLVLMGWSLGMIESICLTICVGFSIDFVAHLAVAYNESEPEQSRYVRTRTALSELGISITSAGITTSGSALFLLPTISIGQQKMGAFVCFDVALSLFFAVGLFSALLATVGPEGGAGSIEHLLPGFLVPSKRRALK